MKTKVTQLKELLDEILNQDFGYPVSGSIKKGASSDLQISLSSLEMPNDYIAFINQCSALSAPDIHNGYFLHPVESVLADLKNNDSQENVIFGSDGGGNQFLINRYDLGIFKADPTGSNLELICDTFTEFVSLIIEDWKHFRDADHNWKYIT